MSSDIKKDTWYHYIGYFFVFCFTGWLYEVCWGMYWGIFFDNPGYLHGCYLPIYGFGGTLLLLSLKKLMSIRRFYIPLLVFLAAMLIVSVVEFSTSYVMEAIYDKRWWDYSGDKFNLDGRISLRNSLILSAGGMFFLYILYPLLKKLFSKISDKILRISAILIVIIMVTDLIFVLSGY
jgi:uncharacterized membrane protein